jgi:hypothetical protein
MVIFMFCYLNIAKAYLFDSNLYTVILTLIIIVMASVKFFKRQTVIIPAGELLIFMFLLILALGFSINYQGEALFRDLFLYHLTLMLFLPIFVLLDGANINKTVLLLFTFIFWADSFVMLLELIDGLMGFDIHRLRLFGWYIDESDTGRFYEFKMQSSEAYFDILPAILGLRGYPNYTAPLFTASFVLLLAVKYSEKKTNNRQAQIRASFFAFGSMLVFAIGVKTHMVTLGLCCLLIGLYLNKLMFRHMLVGILVLVLLTIFTDYGAVRFGLLVEQLFEGGLQPVSEGRTRDFEPGRLETIFNIQAFASLLDLRIQDFIFGAGRFSILEEFDMMFENKILIIGIVLGVPYMGLFSLLVFRAIKNLFPRSRFLASDSDRGLQFGISLAIIVLFLETGHSGYTFQYPNFQVFVFLVALSMVFRHKPNTALNRVN